MALTFQNVALSHMPQRPLLGDGVMERRG